MTQEGHSRATLTPSVRGTSPAPYTSDPSVSEGGAPD
jgi:hypothetical protein